MRVRTDRIILIDEEWFRLFINFNAQSSNCFISIYYVPCLPPRKITHSVSETKC